MQTNNAFSTNILMFCDNIHESKSSILLFFVKFENIKNRLIFFIFRLVF